MKHSVGAFSIRLHKASIKAPSAIGTVERYHGPARMAYNKIRDEECKDTSDNECFQLVIFAFNCIADPERVRPAFFVFNAERKQA